MNEYVLDNDKRKALYAHICMCVKQLKELNTSISIQDWNSILRKLMYKYCVLWKQ